MGGRITFPLFAYYHSTKFAIEGYSESLNYELNVSEVACRLGFEYNSHFAKFFKSKTGMSPTAFVAEG